MKKEITINGQDFEIEEERISYEEIVSLLGKSDKVLYSTTYSVNSINEHGERVKRSGIITTGEDVRIESGMNINSYHTGNA